MRLLFLAVILLFAGAAHAGISPPVGIDFPAELELAEVMPDPVGGLIALAVVSTEEVSGGYESGVRTFSRMYRQSAKSSGWDVLSPDIREYRISGGKVGWYSDVLAIRKPLTVTREGTVYHNLRGTSASGSQYSRSSSTTDRFYESSHGRELWRRGEYYSTSASDYCSFPTSNWTDYVRPAKAPLRKHLNQEFVCIIPAALRIGLHDLATTHSPVTVNGCSAIEAGAVLGEDEPLVVGQFGNEIRSLALSGDSLTSETLVVYPASSIKLRGAARSDRGSHVVFIENGVWAIDLVANGVPHREWSAPLPANDIADPDVVYTGFSREGRLILLVTRRSGPCKRVVSLAENPDGSFRRFDFTSSDDLRFSDATYPWETPAIAMTTAAPERPFVIHWDDAAHAWRSDLGTIAMEGATLSSVRIGENAAGELILAYIAYNDTTKERRGYSSIVDPNSPLGVAET